LALALALVFFRGVFAIVEAMKLMFIFVVVFLFCLVTLWWNSLKFSCVFVYKSDSIVSFLSRGNMQAGLSYIGYLTL
jgi:hypothetical protein